MNKEQDNIEVSTDTDKVKDIIDKEKDVEQSKDVLEVEDVKNDNIEEEKEKNDNNLEEKSIIDESAIDIEKKIEKTNRARKRLNILQPLVAVLILLTGWFCFALLWEYSIDSDESVYIKFRILSVVFNILVVIFIVFMYKRFRNSNKTKNIFMILNLFALVCVLAAKKSFITIILVVGLVVCFLYQWRYEKLNKDDKAKKES